MLEIFGSVIVALITALFGPIVVMWVKKKITKPVDTLKTEIYQIEKTNFFYSIIKSVPVGESCRIILFAFVSYSSIKLKK